jgi:hypothetical protein
MATAHTRFGPDRWQLLENVDSSYVVPRLIAAQQISQVIKNIYLHSVLENMKIWKAYWQLHNLIYEGETYASVTTKLFL